MQRLLEGKGERLLRKGNQCMKEEAGSTGDQFFLVYNFVCSHLWRRIWAIKPSGIFGFQENHSVLLPIAPLCLSLSVSSFSLQRTVGCLDL